MENDRDYGGTGVVDIPEDCQNMQANIDETLPTLQATNEYQIEDDADLYKIASLQNPEYTDSLTSAGSDVAFLEKDKNQIWEQKDDITDNEAKPSVEYLENPAYVDSITSAENQLSPLLRSDVENNESITVPASLQDIWDDTQNKKKEFEISIVEIVPHIPHADDDEPLWESTAYIDEYSCASPGTRRLERVCQNAMLHLSQDLSCKGSMKGSTLLPVLINQIPDQPVLQEEESLFEGNEIKNLLVMSFSVAFMNAAFSSLRNLQSSLNPEDGVGLYSLTGSCAAFTFLSVFTPSLIQQFKPKRCFLVALVTHLLYVAANVIPEFYILVPASILQGAGSALMWNSVSTYITYLARSNAIRNDKRTVHVASKYFGIFFCFYQLSVVVGNLISSVVLFKDSVSNTTLSTNSASNLYLDGVISDNISAHTIPISINQKASICGAEYCHSFKIEHETLNVQHEARYNLLGIYGVATVLSLILPMLLMDPLRNYRTSKVNCKHICSKASSVMRCIVDPRFLTCFIMFFYSNMELGFVLAEVTKAFVTCPLGIHMVGYTMICFGICGSISSFIGGKIEKHVGNVTLISTATIIDLSLVAVMLTWVPDPDNLYYFFILLGAWGIGDGIWISQVNCVVSTLFPDQLEEAFAALRVVNGLGMTIGFAYASSLCMTYKMYILFAICLSGTVVYVISEMVRKCRTEKPTDEDEIKI